jgi:hypothetical protein
LSKYRKAQFFVLSAFAIVTILYFVSQWIAPYTIQDTSAVAMMEESYIFNNIAEKTDQVVSGSRTCEELIYNLGEYKIFVEKYVLEKNMKLDFNYTVSSCSTSVTVNIKMELRSPSADLVSNFNKQWPS